MDIGDIVRNKIKILEQEEKELNKKLTKLYNIRNMGGNVDNTKLKNLSQNLREVRLKLKEFRKMIKPQ